MKSIRTAVATVVAAAGIAAAVAGAGVITSGHAQAYAASCSISVQAPYRHERITGQHMVYGSGELDCPAWVSSAAVHVRLAKLVNGQWTWYGSEAVTRDMTNGTERALANEFLTGSYGWSGGGGTFETYTWANYTDVDGTHHSTGYIVSGARSLWA